MPPGTPPASGPGPEPEAGPGADTGADTGTGTDAGTGAAGRRPRKQVLLRLDPQVHDALARWAGEELRSANAQIEFLLRRALAESGRLPGGAAPIPPRGRPRTPPQS
ncbi:type II toxin-antitoxin system antitoxin [Streptomyces xanthophaeus]|uniref:AT hook motif protein n=1 Tax=Streptomyces xanthophaeus TaxID=67385 RepID=UPI003986D82A